MVNQSRFSEGGGGFNLRKKPPESTSALAPQGQHSVKEHRANRMLWLKSAQALFLAVAICFSLGASDASSRFNDLGHRLMCTCSCAQLLGECNHVGCPESGRMRDELTTAIASGLGDKKILAGFASKYGATVLAAPTTHGFDLVAWVAPFAVFAAALMGTILLIKRWGGLGGGKPAVATATADVLDPAERARLERIRRETGSDGGY
jgi:cytochrome c-type biogenesis protein CcmH/NrfF